MTCFKDINSKIIISLKHNKCPLTNNDNHILTDPDNWLELPPGLKRSVI